VKQRIEFFVGLKERTKTENKLVYYYMTNLFVPLLLTKAPSLKQIISASFFTRGSKHHTETGLTSCKLSQLIICIIYLLNNHNNLIVNIVRYIDKHSKKGNQEPINIYTQLLGRVINEIYTTCSEEIPFLVNLLESNAPGIRDRDFTEIHNIDMITMHHKIFPMGLVNIKNNNKSSHGYEYGVVDHYFTIIYFEEDETYYINSSYGSNFVAIKQYTTLLDIDEFNNFCDCLQKPTLDSDCINSFISKYFLNSEHGNPIYKYIEDDPSEKCIGKCMPGEGCISESNLYTEIPDKFRVLWFHNYIDQLSPTVLEKYEEIEEPGLKLLTLKLGGKQSKRKSKRSKRKSKRSKRKSTN
jgi:hypothetical protein